jgi:ribonuclease HI
MIGLSCLSIHNTGRNTYIISDSQAAIKALESFTNSKLAWDCHQSLVKLAGHNRNQLVWVSIDMEIDGYERTDQVARQGLSQPLI